MQVSQAHPGADLTVSGRVGGANVADLRQVVLAGLDAGTGEFLLDVQGLMVTDRCVLGMMLEAHRRAVRHDRTLYLVNVPSELDRLLRRTRLDRILNYRLDLEELSLVGVK